MRAALASSLLLVGCAGSSGKAPAFCTAPTASVVDGPIVSAVGTPQRARVRFENPTLVPTVVREVRLEGDADFRLVEAPAPTVLTPGTCDAPTQLVVDLEFVPDRPGTRTALLHALVGEGALSVALAGIGLGTSLEVQPSLSFGRLAVGGTVRREALLRNVGTVGTALEVTVEAVRALNPTTAVDELCLGECPSVRRVRVVGSTRLPLVFNARTPGEKAWEVTFHGAGQGGRHTLKLFAEVLDPTGCQPAVVPERLRFESSPRVQERSVRLENRGTGPCVLTGSRFDRPDFYLVRPVAAPRVLVPGTSMELRVGAGPTANPATLEFTFDGTAALPVPIEFAKFDPTGCLVANPAPLDFGSQSEGCNFSERRVSLTNLCPRPVTVRSVTTQAPFIVTSVFPLPTTLAPAASVVVFLRTIAMRAGQVDRGVLRVEAEGTSVEVPLISSTTDPLSTTESWQFQPRPRVDLLYVLDEASAFGSFAPSVRAGLEWTLGRESPFRLRLGVTSSNVDGPMAGVLRRHDGGVANDLWPWTPAAGIATHQALPARFALTDGGVTRRSCVEAALRAVTEPLASGANAGFRSGNGALHVICLTAGRDEAVDLVSSRDALRDAGVRSISVVAPLDGTCLPSVADGGHEVTTAGPDGWLDDLCDWPGFFGLGPTGFRTTYFLASRPDLRQPVTVALNGASLSAQWPDGGTRWRYDQAANAVRFEQPLEHTETVLDERPSTLTVRYRPACF
ncbi:MAG: hypothetical protein SFW67_11200 [Myxococcaceae bacterium]|nr:hypothetical protein [Myxococcaceae bacterium]